MADYPDLIQTYASTQKDEGGFSKSRTISGKLKMRSYYTSDVREFVIQHDLDDTDKATHEAFYAANRKLIFNFTWKADGQIYTCRFTEAPKYKPAVGSRWLVTVEMEVV